MPTYRILIVDDDRLLQNSLRNILCERYETIIAGSGEEVAPILRSHAVDLVMLDIRLPGIDGIETLKLIRKLDDKVHVIMMTAYEDIKTVITSMKMGAYDYLVKPLEIDELELIIEKALETVKLKKEVEQLRQEYLKQFGITNIIGESEGIKEALRLAAKVANTHDTTALIEGETGTGKEIIAKAIHSHSNRIGKPFISINCGAISKDLVESELFGYEKGTFTGGLQEGKKGKFELADGGTLFLDEIEELAPSAQVKLLRVLEEREFYPVGGTEKRKIDVRIIAATNRGLEHHIKEGNFREDLYYRLNVIKIYLPPLKERKEDIIPLVLYYMNRFNEKFGKTFHGVAKDAEKILVDYPWKGNVRELRNIVERVILLETDKLLQSKHLSFLPGRHKPALSAVNLEVQIPFSGINIEELNRSLLIQALKMSRGNKTKAAKLLGLTRATMLYRLDKFDIRTEEAEVDPEPAITMR
ncbi:MAG: sigma-54 dependent transcriptional regulator [Syntrophobacteraceae bacterium]|jgi:DNA-binding NtrC family response regulator